MNTYQQQANDFYAGMAEILAQRWGYEVNRIANEFCEIGPIFIGMYLIPFCLDNDVTAREFLAWANDKGPANLQNFIAMIRQGLGPKHKLRFKDEQQN